MRKKAAAAPSKRSNEQAQGSCLCGAVRFEIDVPAVWAWHDHSRAAQRAQGCAYATYVGSYKVRFRLLEGEAHLRRFEDGGSIRSFCTRCGAPVTYESKRAPRYVNIPRALFET